ncbi:MAG: Nif11-like leader peptide family RiPP precursor [Arenicellales bacterium]|jgi:predicted ribosomally synthesized peptide with nif11-like leader|nr:Nif11-like leader peptide family RiPP precursor [Arenicellales bacterium]|tara:strand:- start:3545 stop:3895 length:351 start_codon:yes stop_codon:yes gene_type:complete
MSKETLEQFMEQVAYSEALQAQIGEEIDAEALISLGAECGCAFTAEDLHESAELSDEELDGVAGGRLERFSYTSSGADGWIAHPEGGGEQVKEFRIFGWKDRNKYLIFVNLNYHRK